MKETVKFIVEIHRTDSDSHVVPMFVRLERDSRHLWAAGTRHTKNVGDAQVAGLEIFFGEWLAETGGGIVCLEGGLPPIGDLTVAAAVAEFGEGAVFAVLGKKSGLKVVSIEPTFSDVTKWALEIMPDPQAFAAWALLNLLSVFVNSEGAIKDSALSTLADAMTKIGSQYGMGGDAAGVFKTLSSYLAAESIVDLPRSLDGLSTAKVDNAAVKEGQKAGDGPNATNRAAVVLNLVRDFGLLRGAVDVSMGGQPVIVWTGLNHLLSQLPALESLGFKKTLPGK